MQAFAFGSLIGRIFSRVWITYFLGSQPDWIRCQSSSQDRADIIPFSLPIMSHNCLGLYLSTHNIEAGSSILASRRTSISPTSLFEGLSTFYTKLALYSCPSPIFFSAKLPFLGVVLRGLLYCTGLGSGFDKGVLMGWTVVWGFAKADGFWKVGAKLGFAMNQETGFSGGGGVLGARGFVKEVDD